MNEQENAKTEIKELYRLRKFIESLDLPLRTKQSLFWDIESAEKRSVENITEITRNSILKELRSKNESENRS